MAARRRESNRGSAAPRAITCVLSLVAKENTVYNSMEPSDNWNSPLFTETGLRCMLSSVLCWKYLLGWQYFVLRASLLAWQIQLLWIRFVRDQAALQFSNWIYFCNVTGKFWNNGWYHLCFCGYILPLSAELQAELETSVRFANDPKPLRSNECPEGRPDLSEADQRRVGIANELFQYACYLFLLASQMGILATMENPRNSYFWITCWVLHLMLQVEVFVADFQVCMLGGSRDKWTRIIANFPTINVLNIKCDRSHTHLPWGFAKDDTGQQVWATSLESQYPRKLCVALVNVVLQFAAQHGLQLRAQSLLDDTNPLLTMQHAQIGAQQQPKKVLPVVPDFASVAVFLVKSLTEVPCSLLSKLPHKCQLAHKNWCGASCAKIQQIFAFFGVVRPS